MNESNSGEKDQDEDENEDHDITRVPWNELDNSQRVRGLKAYYLRNTRRTRIYIRTEINIFLNSLSFCLTKRTLLFHPL